MMLQGHYKITIPIQGKKLTIHKHNIITLLGESFFLNRAIGNELPPIQYICLGNSTNRPRKKDIKLGNETIRKKCVRTVDLDKKLIRLTASFQAKEIQGTKEIGVHNGEILITHDVYNDIDTLLTATTGEITVDYYIELSSGAIRNTEWTKVSGKNYTYYLVEPNNVVGVVENNTKSGYLKVKSISDVDKQKATYHYDNVTKNLYIHTSTNLAPSTEEIIILTGE